MSWDQKAIELADRNKIDHYDIMAEARRVINRWDEPHGKQSFKVAGFTFVVDWCAICCPSISVPRI